MSIFDTLIDKLVARVIAESAAGGDAQPLHPLESPYACTPTRWGDDAGLPEAPRETRPEPLPAAGRRPRRIKLEVHREPAPRGLLST